MGVVQANRRFPVATQGGGLPLRHIGSRRALSGKPPWLTLSLLLARLPTT
ncbi:hypothetical protein [Streptomyces sp. NPDC055107]